MGGGTAPSWGMVPPIPPMLGSPVCICSSTLGGGGGAHVILELDQPPGHQNPPLELSSYLLAHPTVLEGIKNVLQNSLEEILETNSRMSSVSGSRGLKMCTELPYTICNS